METSAELCRAQIAHHRKIADNAELANVREIAEAAEKAWTREAAMAEKRDARRALARTTADALAASEEAGTDGAEENPTSENPDRGHADA